MELLLRHNNKKLITHVNRLKPYFVQSPAAVSSPDFFSAQKDATPPPPVQTQRETEFKKIFPYEDKILEEVNSTDPSPPVQRFPRQTSHRQLAQSSLSSVYGDMPEVTYTDPSPSHQLTFADVVNCPRQRLSLSSLASTCFSLPSDVVASRMRSRSCRTIATAARCSASHAKNCHHASSASTHTKDTKMSPRGHSRRGRGNWITTSKIRG